MEIFLFIMKYIVCVLIIIASSSDSTEYTQHIFLYTSQKHAYIILTP